MAPAGLAIDATAHKPGSISDLVVFQCNHRFHQEGLIKYGNDADIADHSPSTKLQESWAVLMGKGYQGAQQQVQAIIPKKPWQNSST